MPPKAKTAGRGRGPAKRKLAEEFPPGEVLTDTMKRGWKLGAPVGQGGFGLLYLAEENSDRPVGADARYVVKVEPSENGPLFSELHFYMRAAKPKLIESWISHKNQHVGVPRYWGSGLHQWGGQSYRFMVIDRLGTDLQKKLEEGGGRFPRKLVLQLGLRLLDTLEFIHEHEYVHADIKASNLMLSHSDPNQVYLVDYGLAYRYAPDGVLKEYKEDPKRCHDGTMEFTSLEAHRGASACRRSDLEILGYCLVRWLCGRLPWEDQLQEPLYVRDAKIRSRDNIPEFMSQCFPSGEKPGEIQRFLEEVKALGYQDTPPYQKLRGLLLDGLKSIQAKDNGRLDFGAVANGNANGNAHGNAAKAPPVKKTRKRKLDPDPEAEPEAAGPTRKKRVPKPAEASRQKKSPRAAPRPRKRAPPKAAPRPRKRAPPKAAPVETGTQTTPGLAQRTRARKGAP